MEKKYPFVRQAYDILGKDKVQKMKYHQSNIKREIGKHITPANEMQLVRKINEHYPPHQAIPITEVKERLQAIYD